LPTVDITTSVKTITQDDEDIEQKLANLGITEDMLSDPEEVKKINKKNMRAYISLKKKLEDTRENKTNRITTNNISFMTSIEVFGTVKESASKIEAKHSEIKGIELEIDRIKLFGQMAPLYPVCENSEPFKKLEAGHLTLRLPQRRLFTKARSCLLRHIRDFYYKQDYIEITPPTIVQTQVEGGSTLFSLDYYGEKAYLTQSSQLYLETVAPVAQKVYCISPSYRAEKSNTMRHVSEYTHVEAELCDINFNDLQQSIESLICYASTKFYEEMKDDILEIYPKFEFCDTQVRFKRMTYEEAINYLNEHKYLKTDETSFEIGDDIPDAAERFICKDGPVILTNFLIEQKPFYMKHGVIPGTTESMDVLYPGVGEIVGGSMRTENLEHIIQGFEREGIDPTPYYWYIDLMKYGASSHGGYGLGFERLLMALMKWDSINMATLYPRFVNRAYP
ncbi:putative asparagine--tRNA ligase, cytoplasmic, partial [Cucumispora dikerogammari]